ncbi:MAG: amidohydrolase family protein [Ignavibacteria bacterium]|nr:amidohydrolase family protein [Ignavibacteria bacterium]
MLITNAFVCTIINGEKVQPVFGDLTIENNTITGFTKKEFTPSLLNSTPSQKTNEIYDAAGRLVTIPLVNFHDHIYSRLAKGQPVLGPSGNFEEILENLWWKLDSFLDAPMNEASAQLTALEAIRNGVTYIIDHHSSQLHAKESLKVLRDTLDSFGLRSILCFETTDRNGEAISAEGFNENVQYAREHCNADHQALFGLHASFTLNDETLEKVSAVVKETGLGVHIHLYEDKADRLRSMEKFGKAPVARLVEHGLLNEKSIVAHGLFLDAEELPVIAATGTSLAFNVDSNMNNAVGFPDFASLSTSLSLLAGTDGMHDNLARSLKQIFLAARLNKLDFGQAFGLAIKIYFDQVRFIKRYFPDYTDLQPGSRADLIIWDYVPPTPLTEENFWGHYLYGVLESPVCTVMQNGNFLMKDYQLAIGEKENAIRENIYLQGKRMRTCFEKELEKK